jgi:hypothetical protein
MKILKFVLFIGVALIVFSCKKSDTDTSPQKGISYPDSIIYGRNILSLPDSTLLVSSKSYDLGAILEKDATLSLVITNLSASGASSPTWFYDNNTGWSVLDYVTPTQKFISSQSGKINLQIIFETFGNIAKCKIDFYENSTTITRTKYLKWL